MKQVAGRQRPPAAKPAYFKPNTSANDTTELFRFGHETFIMGGAKNGELRLR